MTTAEAVIIFWLSMIYFKDDFGRIAMLVTGLNLIGIFWSVMK